MGTGRGRNKNRWERDGQALPNELDVGPDIRRLGRCGVGHPLQNLDGQCSLQTEVSGEAPKQELRGGWARLGGRQLDPVPPLILGADSGRRQETATLGATKRDPLSVGTRESTLALKKVLERPRRQLGTPQSLFFPENAVLQSRSIPPDP